jgi:cytochrome c553
VPSLAGEPEFYIHWQLILFRDNRRRDPQMSPVAASLNDTDAADLAAYYAAQRPTKTATTSRDAQTMTTGGRLAQLYHCASCHAPELAGPRYAPNITGQPYEYLLKQLRGFKSQTRGDLDGTMTTAAQPLSDEEIEILARYLASLPPATRP